MNILELQNQPVGSSENSAEPVIHAEPPVCSRRTLRRVLNQVLAIPSQVDAFLVDFYPEVYQQTSVTMDRESKLNLLFSWVPEAQLTRTLQQEYPQELQQAAVPRELLTRELGEDKRIQYTVVLTATISELDVFKVYALINHLRKYTADSELTVEQLRSGSVIITCAGSESGFNRLAADFAAGQLATLLGYPVQDIVLGADYQTSSRLGDPGMDIVLEADYETLIECQTPRLEVKAARSLEAFEPAEVTLRIKRPKSRTQWLALCAVGVATFLATVALLETFLKMRHELTQPDLGYFAKMASVAIRDTPPLRDLDDRAVVIDPMPPSMWLCLPLSASTKRRLLSVGPSRATIP